MGIKTINMNALSDIAGVIDETVAAGGEVRVKIKGRSMEPFLVEGRDSVYFSALPERKIKVGDVLLFKRENGVYVAHRVYSTKGGALTFVGDSQTKLEPGIGYDRLVAYVGKAERKGRTIKTDGIWKLVFTLWMKFRVKHPKAAFRLLGLYPKIARKHK